MDHSSYITEKGEEEIMMGGVGTQGPTQTIINAVQKGIFVFKSLPSPHKLIEVILHILFWDFS